MEVALLAIIGVVMIAIVLVAHSRAVPSKTPAIAQNVSTSGPATTEAAATSTAGPGQTIQLPSSASGDLTLVQSATAPTISQRAAMQIVQDLGVPWGLGGIYKSQQVTVSATFGLATFGHPGPPSMPWVGDQNIPIKGTNTVLNHIENRPMWIIDYGNVTAYGSQAEFNHAVYAVDAESKSVLKIWFYQGS